MLTSEAQVLIIDDDPGKATDLREMIEASGGTVVKHITDFDAAVETLGAPDFPSHPQQPNVVLLDGEMRPRIHTDGSRLFTLGRRQGWLHGVAEHAPGILAVSCSVDCYSSVSHDTGATVSGQQPENWARILEDQQAVPQFAPVGAIERELLEGMEVIQAKEIALGGAMVRRVASLRLSSLGQADTEPATYTYDAPELTAIVAPQRLAQIISGREGPKAARLITANPAFSTQAVIETPNDLIVLSRDQRPNPHALDYFPSSPILTDCAFDRMLLTTLDQIPALYWADRQLDPSTF